MSNTKKKVIITLVCMLIPYILATIYGTAEALIKGWNDNILDALANGLTFTLLFLFVSPIIPISEILMAIISIIIIKYSIKYKGTFIENNKSIIVIISIFILLMLIWIAVLMYALTHAFQGGLW